MNLQRFKVFLRQRRWPVVLLCALTIYLQVPNPQLNHLEQVMNSGVLRAALRTGPLNYYEREGQPSGLDYNLLSSIAQELGLDLEVQVFESLDEQLASVYSTPRFDLAAATLTQTPAREQLYQFSKPYMEVSAVLVQHSSREAPDNLDAIITDDYQMAVISGSSHAELLKQLQHPELEWQEETETIMFQMLERVQNRELDYSVVDSSIFALERSMFPRVEVAIELSEPQPVGLVLAKGSDSSLLNEINMILENLHIEGKLEELRSVYFEDRGRMDVAGSLLFKKRLEQRLPEYEERFRRAAREHNYDWSLLAAQAYQESHWNAEARSPTGVRGLMMLTLPTARQLGVSDRLDPDQSLDGGIRYLMELRNRLPQRIQEPDRTKLALAAYNVGFGHLEDGRILTQRHGGNPDTWDDVQKYLPLLRQKKYYLTVKRGYARGTEPVGYVNSIYRFKSILDWYSWQRELNFDNMFASSESMERNEEEQTPYRGILDPPLSPR